MFSACDTAMTWHYTTARLCFKIVKNELVSRKEIPEEYSHYVSKFFFGAI